MTESEKKANKLPLHDNNNNKKKWHGRVQSKFVQKKTHSQIEIKSTEKRKERKDRGDTSPEENLNYKAIAVMLCTMSFKLKIIKECLTKKLYLTKLPGLLGSLANTATVQPSFLYLVMCTQRVLFYAPFLWAS